MAADSDRERVWRLIEKIGYCMLAAREGRDIRARPMAAFAAPDENAIYFLVDGGSQKQAQSQSNVCLAFADVECQNYVSLSSHAELSNDRAKIKELWSTPARAWWESPDDPAIRVLKVTPKDAQYWDSPGTIMSYVEMLAAAVADNRPDIGYHGKVRMKP